MRVKGIVGTGTLTDETLKKILKIIKVAVKNHEEMKKWTPLKELMKDSHDEVKEYKAGQGQVQV